MTTISAVITTYRRPETLTRAIESVLAQHSLPNELLIIDNANDEQTRKVVSYYADSAKIPVRYFVENKRGVSAARNRGLKESACAYVAFLDDDDVWLLHHLSDFKLLYQEFHELALFGGLRGRFGARDEELILPDSRDLFQDYSLDKTQILSIRNKGLLQRPFYTPSMSESIVDVVKARNTLFDEELTGREDIDFVWRLGDLGCIVIHHKVHGLADQLETSLFSVLDGAKLSDRLIMDLKKAYCGIKMLDKIVTKYPHSKALKRARASAYFDSAYVNALAGNTRVSFNHFFDSLEFPVELKHLKLLLRLGASLFLKKMVAN